MPIRDDLEIGAGCPLGGMIGDMNRRVKRRSRRGHASRRQSRGRDRRDDEGIWCSSRI